MSHSDFIHLRLQSAYSLLEGAMHPTDIATACIKHAMPAAAVTDRNNMFGAMEISDALTSAGVQPIMGALLSVLRPLPATAKAASKSAQVLDGLVLLAQSESGYLNLIKLVSAAHIDVDNADAPHITFDVLAKHAEGLIALTGGVEGALYKMLAASQNTAAELYLQHLKTSFADRLYIELNRIGDPGEVVAEAKLIELAYAHDLPLVATNPVLFNSAMDYEAHDILLCIQQSTVENDEKRQRLNPEVYFKSPRAMEKLFADVPEAIANTLIIAKRCAIKAPSRDPILPNFASGNESYVLRAEAERGLAQRLVKPTAIPHPTYNERLAFELGVIIHMGFSGYFLIVADFIKWAKDNNIPVGPGRGSGAGSVVAWALGITDLDPLYHGLLFERFLNPERVSMPDFDIDFCETRRGEVIRYVQEKYGRDHVAQIITFGKLKARAVVKDVGRALHMPYGQVDSLSKMIPNNPATPVTLSEAIAQVAELREKRRSDSEVGRLIDAALQLEGLYRHASTHAAGVVIGDRPLDQLVPLYRDPRSDMAVTQFDMKWVEKAGLIKFDFLGLKTLSVLQRAIDLLKQRDIHIDLLTLPWDDKPSYELMARGDTVGVFQLESEGMRRTLAQVRPDGFGDIVALVALYRPGPMDNIPSFAKRKNNQEAIDYIHPLLEPVLRETYGIIIYQEQVMQIAQILAGYSLGEADLLRRAMGKKKQDEMDAQKQRFIDGAKANGVNAQKAASIFELVDKFAGYGFNKSHAAGYALIAYQTAYLKANYPVEFFAASMAYDITNTDKLAVFADDMKRSGVKLLPPNINKSDADFSVEKIGDANSNTGYAVRYALAALKGVGEKAMDVLVAERMANGPYLKLGDLATRLDPRQINKRSIESLVGGGALDDLVKTRAAAHTMVEQLLAHANAAAEARQSTQVSLFGDSAHGGSKIELMVPNIEPWPIAQQMAMEKEAVGFYLSAHPLDGYTHVLAANNALKVSDAMALEQLADGKRSVTLAGIPEEVRVRPGKKGGQFALLNVSDQSGLFQVGCFDDALVSKCRDAVAAKEPILIRAELLWRPGEDVPRINAREITPLSILSMHTRADLDISVHDESALFAIANVMDEISAGRGLVRLHLMLADGDEAELALPGAFMINANVRGSVAAIPGVSAAVLS